jgi:transcriptional regulator GlxA family with amidase domain
LGHGCQTERVTAKGKRVWFLAAPNTGLLNIGNPWEVFGHANDLLGRSYYELELYGPQSPLLTTGHGLVVSGFRPLPRAPRRLPDIAVVAGGSPRLPLPPGEARIVDWLRRHRRRIPTLVSICTGAFTLGAAGALDGRRATTHWLHLSQLGQRFPKTRAVDEGIFVHDRGVWTSAGLTAGVDLTLALVEGHHGHALAMAVAKRMVLFLKRSGHQAQFSSALRRQEQEPVMRDFSAFVLEHLDESLSVASLARGVGMSPRTLSRFCRKHLAESPAEVVRRLRLEEAQRLLQQTPLPLKDVATRTGLGDTSTLWRVFVKQLGVTPAAYRERFSSALPVAG